MDFLNWAHFKDARYRCRNTGGAADPFLAMGGHAHCL
jgi:hypothetical protein